MKKLLLTLVITSVLSRVFAQEKGVHFEQGLNFQQVKEEARKENKYIFVDCYATWCGPCKTMDKNVYPLDSVGEIINKGYISLKLQCDTTKNDSKEVKATYADARRLIKDYHVDAYPTFLFFSPDGEIIHKGVGYEGISRFVQMVKDSQDPAKQYYTQLAKYQQGKLGPAETSAFAAIARRIDKAEFDRIGAEYIQTHLNQLSDDQFYTKANLEALNNFQANLHTKDRSFVRLIEHPEKIDGIMKQKGYAFSIASGLINTEYIAPVIKQAKANKVTPDWNELNKRISAKYEKIYADKNVARAKLHWYEDAKDSVKTCEAAIERVELSFADSVKNGALDVVSLNNYAWNLFQLSKDSSQLRKALSWADLALSQMTDTALYGGICKGIVLDTKANLLYKLGAKQQAITLETEAIRLVLRTPELSAEYITSMKAGFKKMKENEKTW